jgi:hypothetical protein
VRCCAIFAIGVFSLVVRKIGSKMNNKSKIQISLLLRTTMGSKMNFDKGLQ